MNLCSKTIKLFPVLLFTTLILVLGIFMIDPVYANSAKDDKGPCGETCSYVGMTVNCYDYHCDQSSVYKHGAYFRYYCVDTCNQTSWYQTFFQYCRTTC